MSRTTGFISRYFHDRGYGFIKAKDGRNVFFNYSDVEAWGRSLKVGDSVEFDLISVPKGWAAKEVIVTVDQPESDILARPNFRTLDPLSYQSERYYREALAAKDERDFDQAKSLFEKAIKHTTNPYVFLSYAAMEESARRGDNALRVLQEGIKILPAEGILYEHFGMRLRRRGDLKRAADIFRRGLRAAPSFAKQLHWSLAIVLASTDDDASFQEAAFHAEQAKHLGMTLDAMPNDIRHKLSLVTGPELGRKSWDFLRAAGFDIRVEDFNDNFADLLIASKQIEYTESYDLQGRILARCLFHPAEWKNINDLLQTIRKSRKYRGFNLNTEIAFLIAENINEWRDALYRIVEDSREVIVPIENSLFLQNKEHNIVTILRQILDQWLSRRDLFHYRFPVSGRQFYGRESELQNLMRNIDDGQHTGIYGLRKVGKTSLMYQIQEKRPNDIVVYIDLQKIAGASNDCAYLYWKIARALQESIEDKRQNGIQIKDLNLKLGCEEDYEKIDKPEERNPLRFDSDINQIIDSLDDIEGPVPSKIVITIDELEWMLPAPGYSPGFRGYSSFFAHLRGISQTTQGRVVSIVTAANPTVSEQGKWEGRDNPVFQFYKDMFLPPLAQKECYEMIEKLGRGMGVSFENEALEHIYNETGGHPYITRQFCSHIVHLSSSRPLHITQKMVVEGTESFLRQKGDIFEEILERLNYFPQEKDLFYFIAEGLSEENELSTLTNEPIDIALRHLIGYQIIDYRDNNYYIKINLLYRWLRRYRLGYKDPL
ncbi:cold shock domain-containing protein [Kouleothrix sp.]|uniref:cold shock domain-containing protein n=1 Tax=Kouleothrix sp. TaxID=2779161 RepID=UPI00391D8DD2